MTKISDFELNIALKVGANSCLEADVNEFLNLDTDSYDVAPYIEKRVSRKLRFDEWKALRTVSAKALKIAMLVLVCGVSLFFATAMAISPVRAAFFGAITTWYDEYIEVKYEKTPAEEKAEESAEFTVKKPKYIPDGFNVVSEFSNDVLYSCDYMNSDSSYVFYSQYKHFEDGIDIDDDVVDRKTMYLKNGTIEAIVFIYENNQYIVIWKDQYLFYILSEGVDLEEVIKIAESVK